MSDLVPGESLLDHIIDNVPELDWKVIHYPDSDHFNYLMARITLLKNCEKVSDFRVSTHLREYDFDDAAEDQYLIERSIVYNHPNID